MALEKINIKKMNIIKNKKEQKKKKKKIEYTKQVQ